MAEPASEVPLEVEPEDEDMGPEARMEFLRSRGIIVETVEDRKKAAEVAATQPPGLFLTAATGYFEIALYPCDDSLPISSVFVQQGAGDVLPSQLRPAFADGKELNSKLLSSQMAELKDSHKQLSTPNTPDVTAGAMQRAVQLGSVETFPLVHPAESNDFCGVYIYLDEVGMLKGLPLNARATKIAVRCGFDPPPNFHGDIYIGTHTAVECITMQHNDAHHCDSTNKHNTPQHRACGDQAEHVQP
jgi:hypothetical protein